MTPEQKLAALTRWQEAMERSDAAAQAYRATPLTFS